MRGSRRDTECDDQRMSRELGEAPSALDDAELLRRLTVSADGAIDALQRLHPQTALDGSVVALARIAALVAAGAPDSAIRAAVEAGVVCGMRAPQVLAALAAITDIVGTPRVVSAAPKLALAMGYELDLLTG